MEKITKAFQCLLLAVHFDTCLISFKNKPFILAYIYTTASLLDCCPCWEPEWAYNVIENKNSFYKHTLIHNYTITISDLVLVNGNSYSAQYMIKIIIRSERSKILKKSE